MDETICELPNVDEFGEGYPVKLVFGESSGRLAVQARNEGGNNTTEIDLMQLLAWARHGPMPRLDKGILLEIRSADVHR